MNILRLIIIFVLMVTGTKAWANSDIVTPSGMVLETNKGNDFYNKMPANAIEHSAEPIILKKKIVTELDFDAPVKSIRFGDKAYVEVEKEVDNKTLYLWTFAEFQNTNMIVGLDRGNGKIQKINFDILIRPKDSPDIPTRQLDLTAIKNPFEEAATAPVVTSTVTVVPQALLSKGAPKSSRAVNQVVASKNGINLVLQSIDYYDNGAVLNIIVDNKSPANLDMSHRSIAVYDEAAKKLLTTKTYTDTSILYAGKQRLVNIVIEESVPQNVTITMPYDSSKGVNITGSAQIGGN